MANVFGNVKSFIKAHKIITAILSIVLLIIIYYGYANLFKAKTQTTYTTASATKGTITTSVSGSGQVSASNSISLQFQASGTLTYLGIQNGQNVYAGQLLAQLDTTSAEKSVRDAQASLDAEQISLQKLEGASTLPTPLNKQNAQNTLNQDYQSSYTEISNAFINLPTIMTDLQNILYGNTFNNYQQNIDYYTYSAYSYNQNSLKYENSVSSSYQTALADYNKNFGDYKSATRNSDSSTINSLLAETLTTEKDVNQAIKDANNLIQFYKDTLTTYNIKTNSNADTALSTLNSDQGKSDSDITSLTNSQNSITNDTQALANSDLDLQSEQLNLQNKQNALTDAKSNLANYYIYAPFSGTIGKVSVQKLAQAGSGTSVATLITTQKVATIPLNEVDVSKVSAGQQVVVTFDALPDLSVAGKVVSVDPIGVVSSGVVTYNVQIAFDTQDSRVKSGMSMSAQIITNVKQDVLLVPNSAVKTQGTTKYVQVLVNGAPQQKIVQVGLSNDTSTEITSGLNEGDKIITQTISANSATSATTKSATSSVRISGITGGAGGFRGN